MYTAREFVYLQYQKMKMRKLKPTIILLAGLTFTIFGCEKFELSSQEVVQKNLVGRWPIKLRVEMTIKNNDTIIRDTTVLLPVDTAVFNKEGLVRISNQVTTYSVDEAGQTLTIGANPAVNWNIKFFRKTSIVLTQEKKETIGTDNFTYYLEEQLIK